jgi:hypothetical protein
MWIEIRKIKVSAKQLKKLDKHKVEQHRKAFEEGEYVMPIDVVKINELEYCINGNGRHRFFGAVEAGLEMIEANVVN